MLGRLFKAHHTRTWLARRYLLMRANSSHQDQCQLAGNVEEQT
jgi:hypothetical protein